MLDIKWVREHIEELRGQIARRGMAVDLDPLRELEADRRQILRDLEELRMERNRASREIAREKKAGRDAGGLLAAMREVAGRIKDFEEKMRECEETLAGHLRFLPNIPDEAVPPGADETQNVEIRRRGEPPAFDFTPRPHWEVGEDLGILDFQRAARMAGARFSLSLGLGARLERALINFMLDLHREKGYRETLPPFMVNRESLFGTGQLPKFEEDLFQVEGGRYFLIPTAEVPVTNIHREEIIPGEELPLKYAAYTPCFRREAGSHGADTRGLIRQHQFNKVELVKIVRPEDSPAELESLVADAEDVLVRLGLPFRTVVLCAGDLGFSAAKTYDLEVWMPAQERYREISSCSTFNDFQARRARIRFRPEPKAKPLFVHTLNGSGLAVGRTVAAILENFQRRDGTVAVPPPLVPYLGGAVAIEAETR